MAKRRFSPAQLAAQRKFAARYGGKKRAATSTARRSRRSATGKTPMAKNSRTRRVARGIRQRLHGKSLGYGAVAGAVAPYSTRVAGAYGPGATMLVAGVMGDNDTLQTMGAFSLGATAVQSLTATAGPLAAGGSPGGLI